MIFQVIFRIWKISMRNDQRNATPSEVKDDYEDFLYDERLHSEYNRTLSRHYNYNYIYVDCI